MFDIFLYKSSTLIIKEHFNSLNGFNKRGAHQTMAKALGIFPSYLSLILRGDRSLNLDQGMLLADYLQLKKIERRYLLRVIELDRAQTLKLKNEIEAELTEIASKEQQIMAKVERSQFSLTLDEAATFFSTWAYSATHLLASITNQLGPQQIAKKLKIDILEAKKIANFLLKTGLWRKEDKKISIGASFIHLEHQSNFINHHHINWRLKAIDRHPSLEKEEELAYSLCMALSEKDALKIRSVLLKTIEDIRKIGDPSPSETIYNLNIDWLKVLKND